MSRYVLDASALLAYLHEETGSAEVAEAVAESACISAANWAETLSKLAEFGARPRDVANDLEEQGLLHGLLEVAPVSSDDAIVIAELRPLTKRLGLSLGDRACLALALRRGLPVLTADADWGRVEGIDVDLRQIRS